MPQQEFWRWTCPITGGTVDVLTGGAAAPTGWLIFNGQVYSGVGLYIIATRLVANPLLTPDQLKAPAASGEVPAAAAAIQAAVAAAAGG